MSLAERGDASIHIQLTLSRHSFNAVRWMTDNDRGTGLFLLSKTGRSDLATLLKARKHLHLHSLQILPLTTWPIYPFDYNETLGTFNSLVGHADL